MARRKSLQYWATATDIQPDQGSFDEAVSSAQWTARRGKQPDYQSLDSRSQEWQQVWFEAYTAAGGVVLAKCAS